MNDKLMQNKEICMYMYMPILVPSLVTVVPTVFIYLPVFVCVPIPLFKSHKILFRGYVITPVVRGTKP